MENEAAEMEPRVEYPPETYRWMSWAAVKFIHRPPLRPLAWICVSIALVMVLGVTAAFFMELNVRVPAPAVFDETLTARLFLEPRDVPNVAVGQRVIHRVEAYPFQHYGLFEGEVLSIERRRASDDPRYEVKASVLTPPALPERLKSTVKLVPGMKADSQIITGKHTLYDVILDSQFGRR